MCFAYDVEYEFEHALAGGIKKLNEKTKEEGEEIKSPFALDETVFGEILDHFHRVVTETNELEDSCKVDVFIRVLKIWSFSCQIDDNVPKEEVDIIGSTQWFSHSLGQLQIHRFAVMLEGLDWRLRVLSRCTRNGTYKSDEHINFLLIFRSFFQRQWDVFLRLRGFLLRISRIKSKLES